MGSSYLRKERYYWLKVLLDGLFLAASFILAYWLRRRTFIIDEHFWTFLPVLLTSWLAITLLSKKYKILPKNDYFSRLQPYWVAAIQFVLLLTLVLYALGLGILSRFIVYGTVGFYFVLECAYLALHLLIQKRKEPGAAIPFAVFFFFIELVSFMTAFFLMYFSKRETFRLDERYQLVLMAMFFTWLLVSLLVHRFRITADQGLWTAFQPFWRSEFLILGLVSLSVFLAHRSSLSRLIIFGSIAAFSILENAVVLAYYMIYQFRRADEDPAELLADELAHPQAGRGRELEKDRGVEEREEEEEEGKEKYEFQDAEDSQEILRNKLEKLFLKKHNDVYEFLKKHLDLRRFNIFSSSFMFADDTENIDIMEDDSLSFFFNFEKVNNFRFVNRVLISLNGKLRDGGVLVGCFESLEQRKVRIFSKFPRWYARVFYVIDFIYKRIMPKLPILKKAYFWLSHGKKRVLSSTEVLGRLYYCGFEVIGLCPINNIYHFIAKKTNKPRTDARPSYGPIFRQRRLGKDRKVIYIYKLRTMHPFAEYLHQYIFDKHKLEESGKIKDDFRITSWGRFFRKTWIDELPMLINWLKRDLKLVGVRPLSETFFQTYPEDLRRERVKFKPGLIPPYYADMPDGIEEVWRSEREYLARYARRPMRTDMAYFFKALNNIFFHHAKSS